MSGPKYDEATLRQMEKERLERERQERIKLMRLAIEKHKNTVKLLKNQKNAVQIFLKQHIETLEGNSDVTHIIQDYEEVQNRYAEGFSKLIAEPISGEAQDIDNHSKIISENGNKLLDEFYVESNITKELFEKYLVMSEANEKKNDFSKALENAEKSAVTKFENSFLSLLDESEKISKQKIERKSKKLNQEVNELINLEGVSLNYKRALLKVCKDIQIIAESKLSVKIKFDRISKCDIEIKQLRDLIHLQIDEFMETYDDYLAECIESGTKPKVVHVFPSIAAIKKEKERVAAQANAKMIQSYIKQQVDEVMAKHGLNIVKSDLLMKNTKGQRELYGVNDSTAINVFISEENEIRMGVIAIGFNNYLTEIESEALYQEQFAFCKLHPDILNELKTRGVLLSAKKYFSPSKKHNHKIAIKEDQKNIDNGSIRKKGSLNNKVKIINHK